MNNLHDHVIMLLRYMLEKGIIATRGISPRKLRDEIGISDNDFDIADKYILQDHLVEGGGGGLDGIRWITSKGVQYITEELRHRIPISLDAERLLRFLIQEIKDNEFLTQDEILKGVNISSEQFNQAFQQLVDYDFVDLVGNDAMIPTKLGRVVVHRNFHETASVPNIQAGAIFNGPVTGANIQAIASAMDSEIQQNVSSLSPEELHKEIQQTLEKLLEQVTEHLSNQQKAAYTQLAADFQKETTKPNPDPGKLHKLLASLGLLSDLGGAIDFSQKTFKLFVNAGPYIMLLSQMVAQLLSK
jgi:DNA replication protein DnaD